MPIKLIPEISEEKLQRLLKRIKPVVRFIVKKEEFQKYTYNKDEPKDGILCYVYNHDPKFDSFLGERPTEEATSLERITTISTFHLYENPLFLPSTAEVLAQIPEQYVNEVVAFETQGANTFQKVDGCHHLALTVLYRKKHPK